MKKPGFSVLKGLLFLIIIAGFMSFSFPYEKSAYAKERKGEVTLRLNLNAPEKAKDVRLWIPYPVSGGHQRIYGVNIKGNFTQEGIYREGEHGNIALYAEWKGPFKKRALTYSYKVDRRDFVMKDFPRQQMPFSEKEFARYLRPTSFGPTSGKVKALALEITKYESSVVGKARAIYNWIVANMYRDEGVKGCGYGKVERLITTRGGKCADISSVFVALARSAGVPAREIFSIRMPEGRTGDMTKNQHCWAEFYDPGYGWVPVDPADVRKAMLKKNTNNLKDVNDLVQYFFGAVDENRIAYYTGRDVLLDPRQSGGRLDYFMYPYAEADGKPIGDMFGFDLGYRIDFKEL
ncbi:MAG: transglutaminase domain-containing protein [Nitrospiraceae bacterium]|nr:transglutaminase domain-containing protein [Nitrospiraceae bacterium]